MIKTNFYNTISIFIFSIFGKFKPSMSAYFEALVRHIMRLHREESLLSNLLSFGLEKVLLNKNNDLMINIGGGC
ncbi:hypothetical protein BpHYR1_021649 [Brachionus plicatilis]|uniref:Uncharacterized protein n=1 Tax=Brachionus plicatilis TaxID=10195 RepID=A0A3M7RUT0_BRAPC|nr:hypothetical protein BpHYR1_021649 [Brachionus plicatilis]